MQQKLGYVEGMRGVAAVAVVASHFLQLFLPLVYDNSAKSWGIGERAFETSPANVIFNPNFAVCLFFVLSGYVLSRGFMADGDLGRIWRAAFKRFPRLMLPVLGSVIFVWVMMASGGFRYGDVRSLSGSPVPDYYAVPRSLLYVVREGAFGVFFSGENSLNPVLWTIGVELYGSFLVFGLLFAFRRWWFRWIGYGVVAALLHGTYYLAFPIGVAIAASKTGIAAKPRLAAALAVAGLALGSYPYYGAGEGFWSWLPQPGSALPGVFYHTIGAALLLQAILLSPIKAAFDGAVFRFLGRISYSLYLVHFTILASLSAWLVLRLDPAFGYLPALATAFVAGLSASVAVAYIFARVIDEPATRVAGRFAWWAMVLISVVSKYIRRQVPRDAIEAAPE
jgi:peptidoglycan/LPS O-acetylase OafA/YrhL